MPNGGFHFQYRLSGLPPSVRRFARADTESLVPGDMASFDAGVARLAATGDVTFLGCVLAPTTRAERHVEVIADDDAVYGVRDPVARRAGTKLDLTGGSGAQTVKRSFNDDFEVVVDSTADEQTLLRITVGRHWEFTVAVPAGETLPSRAPLTRARERELVMAAAAGDRAATAELVEAFLPAIAGVARLYRGTATIERTELLQEGVVGLLRAVGRFDPSLGSPFWAYATWWVRQAMQQLVSELARPTVLSDRAQRGLARIRDTRGSFLQAHRREPTLAELAALVELPRDTVESLLALEQTALPLGAGLGGDDERAGVVGAALADPVAEDEYERILTRLEIEQLRDLTNTLTARERAIVFEHYGLDGPRRTLREIGAELGISAERVRQIEEQALEKIRAAAMLDRQT
jgi:RNA polymerase sigma factor (sigma-70 family)